MVCTPRKGFTHDEQSSLKVIEFAKLENSIPISKCVHAGNIWDEEMRRPYIQRLYSITEEMEIIGLTKSSLY